MPGTGASGVLLFIDRKIVPIFSYVIGHLNSRGRVSEEVLSLHLVQPSVTGVAQLTQELIHDPKMQHVENIHKLKPNNGLKDLIGKNRLHRHLVQNYMLVVGVETVTDKFRSKYPNPNLTLQAGHIEDKETPLYAAVRELSEEAHIVVHWTSLFPTPIRLLGGGLIMYPCKLSGDSLLRISPEYVYIGRWSTDPNSWTDAMHVHPGKRKLYDKIKSSETEDLM